MTRRTGWLLGIAIVLAIFGVGIERIRPTGAIYDTSREPARGAAAKSARTLADILAPMREGEAGGEVDPDDLPPVRLEGIAIASTHALDGVVVTVIAGAELAGLVDDEEGKPVEGASIAGANASTGPDGRFLARGLEEGALEVRAYVDGSSSSTTVVEVAVKRRAEVRLVLVHTEISGVVVDHKGQPVMEATVHATATGESSSTSLATTDEYGKFALGGLPPALLSPARQSSPESALPTSTRARSTNA